MNWKKTKVKDWINPLKWFSFVISFISGIIYAPHIVEQYHMRYIRCSDCIKVGSCKHCGCSMPAKATVFFEQDSADPEDPTSEPKWGPIIRSKAHWQEVKDTYNIRFTFESDSDF